MIIAPAAMARGPFGDKFVSSTHRISQQPVQSELEEILAVTKQLASLEDTNFDIIDTPEFMGVVPVLTHDQIQTYLHSTTEFENQPSYRSMVGLIASKLIQKSHDQGTDYFNLDVRGIKTLQWFGNHLSQRVGHTLDIVIRGKLGMGLFGGATGKFCVEEKDKIDLLLENGSFYCQKTHCFNLETDEVYSCYVVASSSNVELIQTAYYESPLRRFVIHYQKDMTDIYGGFQSLLVGDKEAHDHFWSRGHYGVKMVAEWHTLWKPGKDGLAQYKNVFGGEEP